MPTSRPGCPLVAEATHVELNGRMTVLELATACGVPPDAVRPSVESALDGFVDAGLFG